MSPIVKELRNAAKWAPLWKTIFDAAADEIEGLQGEQNKVKADVVRELINHIKSERPHWYLSSEFEVAEDYANQLERGEV